MSEAGANFLPSRCQKLQLRSDVPVGAPARGVISAKTRRTMKYILLICPDEEFPGAPPADVVAATEAWVKEMEDSGIRLIGDRLRPATEATSVRRRGGKVVTTDGPFAEAKEQFGGFDLIECRDLDQ